MNKGVFATTRGALVAQATAFNLAGGRAYALSPEQALAQCAATGTFSQTFYASAEEQMDGVLALCSKVSPEYVAQVAIFAREKGFMKDAPALLCAYLTTTKEKHLAGIAFRRVIDNSKMLRNFVQAIRSGVVGRKSFGSYPRRLIRNWLEARSDVGLFCDSVGNAPSLADIVKMVHPKPKTKQRDGLYRYLLGKASVNGEASVELPEIVLRFEEWKRTQEGDPPAVPFQMLTALDLKPETWAAIARNGGWQMVRMNLNTFERHGVFKLPGMTELIAAKLRDPAAVRKARAFPYQLMMAYQATGDGVPGEVREALQDAMEVALENVPELPKTYVLLDVSGSMGGASVTGSRQGQTSKVLCVQAASLIASAIARRNPGTEIIPFDTRAHAARLNPRDTVFINAAILSRFGGGGTDCSCALRSLNERHAEGKLVVFVSDNESWMDPQHGRGTETAKEWSAFRARNIGAKLVCIDLTPNQTTQAQSASDVLNVGGFSDSVFQVVADFAAGGGPDFWVRKIQEVQL